MMGQEAGEHDLIETLWNVKIPDDVLENNGTLGFNRDIVECKA